MCPSTMSRVVGAQFERQLLSVLHELKQELKESKNEQ